MRNLGTTLLIAAMTLFCITPAFAQDEGDFRTRDSGDWSDPQIWETFNGSAWVATANPPTGSETITVGADGRADSVYVDAAMTITGHLINQGEVESAGQLTIGDGGTYEHARDEGQIPISTWAEGSTLLMTGVVAEAPEDRNQAYHHIVFNTPDLQSNLNMDLDSVTVSGDIHVIDTGVARWYLTSVEATDSATIEILGDVIVENGAFSVQGTGNGQTTFIVNHYGDIMVTGGNFSISRGSQPGGTTTWYLHEGDFTMSNAMTQSSTSLPGGARFVFTADGTQTLDLGENIEFSALPIEVAGGTTLDMRSSRLGGGGVFVLNEGAGIMTALPGGVAEIFADVVAEVTLEEGSSFTFNGDQAQVTSTLMPTVVQDLTIDNPEGVTLSQATTINGTLTLESGVFDNTIPFTLGAGAEVVIGGGSLLIDTANENEGELPHTFFVEQNFPNPFNPSTVIRYGLPTASDVTLTVYNMLGQKVWTSFEGRQPAGVHEINFKAGDLSSGMYIYRVEAADLVISKRMVLLQ